jgi:hypothetical protein
MKENYSYSKINNDNSIDNNNIIISTEKIVENSQESNFEIDDNRINIKNYKKFFIDIKYFQLGNTYNFFLFNDKLYSYSLKSNQFIQSTIMFLIFIIIFLYFIRKIIKSIYFYIIFLILLFLACFFAFKLLITNPGIILKSSSNINNSYYCNICKIYVERNCNSHHCNQCNVCVYNYDHHCGVFGKCITKKNKKYFLASIYGGVICETFCVLNVLYEILKIYKFL